MPGESRRRQSAVFPAVAPAPACRFLARNPSATNASFGYIEYPDRLPVLVFSALLFQIHATIAMSAPGRLSCAARRCCLPQARISLSLQSVCILQVGAGGAPAGRI